MPDTDSLSTLWQNALQVAYTNPILYRAQQQAEAADASHSADIAFWRNVYPSVELRATDNVGVDFRLLTMPWSVNYGNPPLVFVMVTPRKKDLPKTTGLLQTVGMFAPILSIIPVVGTVLSIALTVASSVDHAERIKNFIGAATSVTASEFEPQFYPRPFPVLLPLDEAQVAVEQPWMLPALWHDFKKRILEAQKRMAQQLAGVPSTLTLSGDLNPQVVSVTPPGGVSPGESNQAWVDRLYSAFGQTTSVTEQFQDLQTSLGSRVPSYGNLTDPATRQWFEQQGYTLPPDQANGGGAGQQAGTSGGGGGGGAIVLALLAGAAILVMHK